MQATPEMLSLILMKSFSTMRSALKNYSDYLKSCTDARPPLNPEPDQIVRMANEILRVAEEIDTYTKAIVEAEQNAVQRTER